MKKLNKKDHFEKFEYEMQIAFDNQYKISSFSEFTQKAYDDYCESFDESAISQYEIGR